MGEAFKLLGALFGGGTIVGLVAVLVHYRADNTRTFAQAGKTEAQADAIADKTLQNRYDRLFDGLQKQIDSLQKAEQRCRKELGEAQVNFARAQERIGQLGADAASAAENVKLARSEIVRLQDRLDRIEAKANP